MIWSVILSGWKGNGKGGDMVSESHNSGDAARNLLVLIFSEVFILYPRRTDVRT